MKNCCYDVLSLGLDQIFTPKSEATVYKCIKPVSGVSEVNRKTSPGGWLEIN